MKTFSHILIILVVAGIIGGILFALVNNNTSGTASTVERRAGNELSPNGNFAPRSERNSGGFNGVLSLLAGAFGELLIISGIVIAWLYAGKSFGRRKAA